jgi:streptomycin 6-kinase
MSGTHSPSMGIAAVPRVGSVMAEPAPVLDPASRQRLVDRFGVEVETWFDELPAVLAMVSDRWLIQRRQQIPRGSVSIVFRCHIADGRETVLKVSPDRVRLASEAAALKAWQTVHVPDVIRFDEDLGAMLIDAVEPGTPLEMSSEYPSIEAIGELIGALHGGTRDPSFPKVERRVESLFESSHRLYRRHPEAAVVISPERYQQGRTLAERLARVESRDVLLHGDLTPSNILFGGEERGLVAIDPAPCIGDAAFDAVDLVLWRAHSLTTIEERAERLAVLMELDASAILSWCVAFAGMNALELATTPGTPPEQVDALVMLAALVEQAL